MDPLFQRLLGRTGTPSRSEFNALVAACADAFQRARLVRAPGLRLRYTGAGTVVESDAAPPSAKRTPPPWWPKRIRPIPESEPATYNVRLQPGAVVEPLLGIRHEVLYAATDLPMQDGDILALNYETDPDGTIKEGTTRLEILATLPATTPEIPAIGDDLGHDGAYSIPLGTFVAEPRPHIADPIRSDIVHRPRAPEAENIGGGAEILDAFEDGYQARTLAPDPGQPAGNQLGDEVPSRIRVVQEGQQVLFRGSARNLNILVYRLQPVINGDGLMTGLEKSDTEPMVVLYIRDGLYLGTEDPEDIGECHELEEIELLSLDPYDPTIHPPCPPPEE